MPPSKEPELERRRWYVLIVMSIGTFMVPFDTTIVAVAIPTMGASLHLNYSYALWTQAAYLLVTSMLLIPTGRMADSKYPLRCNLLGTVIFGLGSVVAGLAPTGFVMIVGRLIQGAGGAFVFSTATGIISAVFPSVERGRAIGLNLTASYLGLMAGPVVGGLIVSHLNWRWIFFINLPITVAMLGAGWPLVVAEHRSWEEARARVNRGSLPAVRRSVDWLGAVLLGGVLGALFFPLTFSPFWGWIILNTVGLLTAAVIFLVSFVIWEQNAAEPMLDLGLIRKNRVFVTACMAAFFASTAVMAVVTLVAVFAEVVQGYSPQTTGLMLLVQPVIMAVVAPFAGRLSDRIGSRLLACLGPLVIAAGMAQLAFASASAGRMIIGLATCGLGLALFSPPNMSAIMGSVDRFQLNLASGFQATMRYSGQGFSIAVLGSIAARKLGSTGAGVIFLGDSATPASAAAFGEGFREAMLVGAGIAIVAAAASWFARPQRVNG